MHQRAPITIGKALALHRMGNLPAAESCYRAFLANAPKNPFLLGQLGVINLRMDRLGQAESLLKRALSDKSKPRVRLYNLHVYLSVLSRLGKEQEARRAARTMVPDWPAGVVPDRATRDLLMVLIRSLNSLDQADVGLRLLEQAFPNRDNDAELLSMEGRLRLATGARDAGLRKLRQAVERSPRDPARMIALAGALARNGEHDEARKATGLIVRRYPYLADTRRDEHAATILVLNPAPREIRNPDASLGDVHFWVNYPSELRMRMKARYRFASLFDTVDDDVRPWEADPPSVVLNNLVDERDVAAKGAQVRIGKLLERVGAPVINPPHAVAQVSRQANAEALEGIHGLKIPRTARFSLAEDGEDHVVGEIGRTIGYPAILRHPSTHSSSDSMLPGNATKVHVVSNDGEAREVLRTTGWREFYAIEFVELRKKQGWYRKLRACCVGDDIVMIRGGCYSEWYVGGWFTKPEGIAFYRAHQDALEHIRAILNDPVAELGDGWLSVLRQIRKRIPLDVFGVDFDIDDAGQVVFFEATAGMIMFGQQLPVPKDLWVADDPLKRLDAAFSRLMARMCNQRLIGSEPATS